LNVEHLNALVWIVGVIFNAGILYAAVGQLRKDLNGIGAKARSIDAQAGDRFLAATLALLVVTEDRADRQAIANILLNAALRR
jgi:hypothetical protein